MLVVEGLQLGGVGDPGVERADLGTRSTNARASNARIGFATVRNAARGRASPDR